MAQEAWDYVKAYERAVERMREAGVDPDELEERAGPVIRARRYLELAAPAVSRLHLALMLGTPPEELDRVRGGARLLFEATKQSLAMVGIRGGDEVTHDVSDRLQAFLTRWQDARPPLPPTPTVLELDEGEEGRRSATRSGDVHPRPPQDELT